MENNLEKKKNKVEILNKISKIHYKKMLIKTVLLA